jgi:hypothetical protein
MPLLTCIREVPGKILTGLLAILTDLSRSFSPIAAGRFRDVISVTLYHNAGKVGVCIWSSYSTHFGQHDQRVLGLSRWLGRCSALGDELPRGCRRQFPCSFQIRKLTDGDVFLLVSANLLNLVVLFV